MKELTDKDRIEAGEPYVITKDLERTLYVALMIPWDDPLTPNCRWGLPILIWGSPGIGKSGRVSTASTKLGLPYETTYPSTRQPEDVSGAAIPSGPGEVVIKSLLPGVKRLIQEGQGVWFIDELSCARPAVQAAFLGAIYERSVGEDRLPGGIRIVAAANPPHEAAGGWELEPPMANRFCHIYIKPPSIEEWGEWLMQRRQSHMISTSEMSSLEDKIKAGWNAESARAEGLVLDYMKKLGKANTLHDMPAEGHPDRGGAWPSPRMWECVVRVVTTCNILEEKSVMPQLLAGCIGKSRAEEFEEYLATSDLPTPEEVLSGKWEPKDMRVDVAFAAYTSTTTFVIGTRDKKTQYDRAVQLWKALQVACERGLADLATKCGQVLAINSLSVSAGQEMKDAASPVLLRMAKKGMAKYL